MATLSATPVLSGSTNATWDGIPAPTPTDWLGVYQAGAANDTFLQWVYVNGSKAPGAAIPSGTCAVPVPTVEGDLELRLLANDKLQVLAVTPLAKNEPPVEHPPEGTPGVFYLDQSVEVEVPTGPTGSTGVPEPTGPTGSTGEPLPTAPTGEPMPDPIEDLTKRVEALEAQVNGLWAADKKQGEQIAALQAGGTTGPTGIGSTGPTGPIGPTGPTGPKGGGKP